jgi:hypothetical protein
MKLTKKNAKIQKELVYVGEDKKLYLWEHGTKGGTLTIVCKDIDFHQINSNDVTVVRSRKDLDYNS